jgi:hypothetical protein
MDRTWQAQILANRLEIVIQHLVGMATVRASFGCAARGARSRP